MCGVVGYVGKNLCRSYIVEGLGRLEYRGYDSAGFACVDSQVMRLDYRKAQGQLKNLIEKLDGSPIDGHIGIGHTRWATHGEISEKNAHPQFDCKESLAIVHNGIIENHHQLRSHLLQENHIFKSVTDTEVIAHCLESALTNNKILKNAILEVTSKLQGAYAFVAMLQNNSDQLIVVRKGSPLCIGIGEDQMFIASDPLAFAGFTNQLLFLPDQSFAIVYKNQIKLYDFSGNELEQDKHFLDIQWSNDEKNGFKHYMLKEIYEQKNSIQASLSSLRVMDDKIWHQLGITQKQIKDLVSINIIAAGTSWHAGRIAQFFFEKLCLIPTRVMLASEFRYMPFFHEDNTVSIFVSQSGETADTLECLRLVKNYKNPTIALTNVNASTIVREADGYLLTKAGQEIAVASTKAFSTQLTVLYWLANRIAFEKGILSQKDMEIACDDLLIAAETLENTIEKYRAEISKRRAKFYAQFKRFIFLGRHISYPFAMEAALKLKEISYIFSQCYPAGELKHGPIALLDEQTPVILFSNLDEQIYQKVLSNAQEVKARKAHMLSFLFEGQEQLQELSDYSFVIPRVNPLLGPLAMTGLMQFFVYEIANVLDCPIDKPRNLAKSVTVE